MKSAAALVASCLLLCAASVAQSAELSLDVGLSASTNVEMAVETRDLLAAGGLAGLDAAEEVLVRRFSQMASTKTDGELREQARLLFRLYKLLNPDEVAALGATEDEQFEKFYNTVFKQIQAKVDARKTPAPAPTSKSPTKPGASPSPTTKAPSSTPKTPSTTPKKTQTTKYSAAKTTDPNLIAESLSFFTEVYDEDLASQVRALQDNTKNIEAIVQSTKADEKSEPANEFQGPTVLEGADEGPTELDGGRRLATNTSTAPPVQVLFCDVGGNAIWKWSHTPYDENVPIKTTTTVSVSEPTKLCESPKVEVKVTAYQSGCSRQNNPEGCDQVYYKGCGGLTVNRASNRIVVARTGGRSLGLLYYKQLSDTCQGRVVDAITTFRGKKFNSPTYAEYSKAGNLYFSDSPFGLATGPADFEGDILDRSPLRELPFNGVFLLKNNSNRVELVDCFMDRPNKIAFSPEDDVMYVTNSRKGNSYVKQFNLKADGTVSSMSTFFNFTAHPELGTDEGYADGIKVDDKGHVYVAAYKGIYIFSAEGALIGTLKSNREVNGLALGGGRMFVSGSFGVVAQATGVHPSIALPKAKTDC